MKRMICSFGITNVLRNDWVYFPFNQILLVDTPSLPANVPAWPMDQNNICHLMLDFTVLKTMKVIDPDNQYTIAHHSLLVSVSPPSIFHPSHFNC